VRCAKIVTLFCIELCCYIYIYMFEDYSTINYHVRYNDLVSTSLVVYSQNDFKKLANQPSNPIDMGKEDV